MLDYETDDEAKGLLDDSEENGKNNWTTTTITFRDVLWTPSVKTRSSVFISVGLPNDNALSFQNVLKEKFQTKLVKTTTITAMLVS